MPTQTTYAGGDVSTLLAATAAFACAAPSVRNSQPWRWRVGPYGVDLYGDPTRRLPGTDRPAICAPADAAAPLLAPRRRAAPDAAAPAGRGRRPVGPVDRCPFSVRGAGRARHR